MRNWSRISACLLACLPACGGGGAAAALSTPLRLAADGLTLAAGIDAGRVTLAIANLPQNGLPVLLECDVVLEPPLLRVAGASPLQALQALPTLDGAATQTGFHLLAGDARTTNAPPLRSGPLFSLLLEIAPPRAPGTAAIRFENLRVVDADGNRLALDPAPVRAQIVVH